MGKIELVQIKFSFKFNVLQASVSFQFFAYYYQIKEETTPTKKYLFI